MRTAKEQKMKQSVTRRATLALIVAALAVSVALPSRAQESQGVRVAGQITRIDGDKLDIAGDDGKAKTVVLAPDAAVTNVVPAQLADIKPGRFVGATAAPESNNRWRASEVHIFAPGARPGEGHYPWQGGPGTTMTNADVSAAAVRAGNGTMTLTTGGQNYEFDVPADTPIVEMKAGTRALLAKGARVSIFRAMPSADGSYTAKAITVHSTPNPPPT
jgi:hypothetical protein